MGQILHGSATTTHAIRAAIQRSKAPLKELAARYSLNRKTEVFSTACELVRAGCGVGLIDPIVSAAFTADIVRRPFRPTITYEIALLYPTHEELSQISRDFIKTLRAHLKNPPGS